VTAVHRQSLINVPLMVCQSLSNTCMTTALYHSCLLLAMTYYARGMVLSCCLLFFKLLPDAFWWCGVIYEILWITFCNELLCSLLS